MYAFFVELHNLHDVFYVAKCMPMFYQVLSELRLLGVVLKYSCVLWLPHTFNIFSVDTAGMNKLKIRVEGSPTTARHCAASNSSLCSKKHVQFLSCDRSTGSCICLLCISVIFCWQGHIHDPVLLSQDRNCTCFLLLIASISVSAILVARNIVTLCCINTRTLYHSPSTTDVPHTHTCALVARAQVKWHHTHISTGCSDVTMLRLFFPYSIPSA